MPTPVVVPDASVLLKWVLPSDGEPDTDKALLLRAAILEETVSARVPSLWLYEVGNTIARRFPDQAQTWLTALLKFGLQESPPSQAWIMKSLELTRRHDITFYDAAYHALALLHDGLFITADTKYVTCAGKSGGVIALSDWAPTSPRRSGRAIIKGSVPDK
jgi:predicted nucleic acid-binding protein